MARLSLILETSILTLSDDSNKNYLYSPEQKSVNKTKDECIFICDEIDAHIGGEASKAAAKLLQKLGEYKQVIAITRKHEVFLFYFILFYFVVFFNKVEL